MKRAPLLTLSSVAALLLAGCGGTSKDESAAKRGLTAAGPATFSTTYDGPVAAIGLPYSVLVGWRVDVGSGGESGMVRIRARSGRPARRTSLGPWVRLSATPGRYRFPAPHVPWNASLRQDEQLELDQASGPLAVVRQETCVPDEDREADPCRTLHLNRYALAGRSGPTGEARARAPGAALRITPITEPDADHDLLGDQTEDRTDLKLDVIRRDGRRLTVRLTNRGPRTANCPVISQPRPGTPRFLIVGALYSCGGPDSLQLDPRPDGQLAPLPAGRSIQMTLTTTGRRPVKAFSEGPDLKPADNQLASR